MLVVFVSSKILEPILHVGEKSNHKNKTFHICFEEWREESCTLTLSPEQQGHRLKIKSKSPFAWITHVLKPSTEQNKSSEN